MNDITALMPAGKFMFEVCGQRWHHIKHGEAQYTEPRLTMVKLYQESDVRALVEALEKAHLEISSANRMMKAQDQELITRRQRIASLESRTVTVKLPAEYLNADGSVNADMANTCPVVSAYREAHRAAGIQVIEGEQKNG